MRSRTNHLLLGIAAAASLFGAMQDANAWVAAARGWGGGAVAVGGYHPAYYHPAGCYGCGAAAGAVAGLAVGAMAGAAIASAAQPTTVVVQAPPTYVNTGYLPVGAQVAVLPPGAQSMVVNGVTYYQSGPTWYRPYFGSSGVYYDVVPVP
jgi:hypothetical protein